MTTRLIANKYREGKAKRTLKRELKVLEIVKGEANVAVGYAWWLGCCFFGGSFPVTWMVAPIRALLATLPLCFKVKAFVTLGGNHRGRSSNQFRLLKVRSTQFQFGTIWFRTVLEPADAEKEETSAAINGDICPVLKHGPRSLTYMQVCG